MSWGVETPESSAWMRKRSFYVHEVIHGSRRLRPEPWGAPAFKWSREEKAKDIEK